MEELDEEDGDEPDEDTPAPVVSTSGVTAAHKKVKKAVKKKVSTEDMMEKLTQRQEQAVQLSGDIRQFVQQVTTAPPCDHKSSFALFLYRSLPQIHDKIWPQYLKNAMDNYVWALSESEILRNNEEQRQQQTHQHFMQQLPPPQPQQQQFSHSMQQPFSPSQQQQPFPSSYHQQFSSPQQQQQHFSSSQQQHFPLQPQVQQVQGQNTASNHVSGGGTSGGGHHSTSSPVQGNPANLSSFLRNLPQFEQTDDEN